MEPETRDAGGIAIAYQTVGDGGQRAHESLLSTRPG